MEERRGSEMEKLAVKQFCDKKVKDMAESLSFKYHSLKEEARAVERMLMEAEDAARKAKVEKEKVMQEMEEYKEKARKEGATEEEIERAERYEEVAGLERCCRGLRPVQPQSYADPPSDE